MVCEGGGDTRNEYSATSWIVWATLAWEVNSLPKRDAARYAKADVVSRSADKTGRHPARDMRAWNSERVSPRTKAHRSRLPLLFSPDSPSPAAPSASSFLVAESS